MPKDFILYALFGGHFLSYSMPDALKIYRIGYNNDKKSKNYTRFGILFGFGSYSGTYSLNVLSLS